jgi:hypothetical protein
LDPPFVVSYERPCPVNHSVEVVLVPNIINKVPFVLHLGLLDQTQEFYLVVGQVWMPKVYDKDQSSPFAIVPGFMLEAVVEYIRLI